MGDAVCTLNPIYGQGMTKAAKEGAFLRKSLTHLADEADLSGLCDRFRLTMGNVGANWAWQLTTGSDLAYPQTVGNRPAGLNLINGYVGRLFASAETSLESRRALTDAMALVQPPESIMRPRLLLLRFRLLRSDPEIDFLAVSVPRCRGQRADWSGNTRRSLDRRSREVCNRGA